MDILQAAVAHILGDADDPDPAPPAAGDHAVPAVPAADLPDVPGAHAAGPPPAAYETTTTYKGKEAIIQGGYVYIVKDTHGNSVYWRCILCNKLKCKAGGKTQGGSREIVLNDKRHNHDPDETEIKAKQLVVKAREEARTQRLVPAANIVDQLLQGASQQVALAVSRDNLLRVANRAKRQDGSQMVNRPPHLIEWPEHFKLTATGERFLLYDSRDNAAEADKPIIFVFASETQLQFLRDNQHWSGDGTFWCCPAGFSQLYTLHANIGHSSVPAAYFLMQNKHEDTYVRALRALLHYGGLDGISPASIMHDFELAAIKGVRAVFQDAQIRLCLFHFAQALWSNVAERGLTQLYRENEKARELIRCFGALALVPTADVIRGLEAIVAELQRLLRVTREIPAAWEPALAGWHYGFNNTFSSAHMAMDKFMERLRLDEDKNRQRIIRHEAFPANPLRSKKAPKYMRSDKHILAVARRYATHYEPNGQILRYLRCMQYHLVKARFPGNDDDADDPLEESDDDDHDDHHDDIPLNESHPGVDSDEDTEDMDVGGNDAAPGREEEEEVMDVGRNNDAAAAGPIGQGQEHIATQGDLPGFSQAAGVAVPARPRRLAAARARTSW